MWLLASILPVIPSIILFGAGYISVGVINILIFSFVQKQVETAYIGRVVTLISSVAAMGMPIGSLIGGAIGEAFLPQVSVIVCGIAMISFSVIWLGSSVLRKLPNIDQLKLKKGSQAI